MNKTLADNCNMKDVGQLWTLEKINDKGETITIAVDRKFKASNDNAGPWKLGQKH